MFRKMGTVTRKSSPGIYLLIFIQLSFIFVSYKEQQYLVHVFIRICSNQYLNHLFLILEMPAFLSLYKIAWKRYFAIISYA